MFVGQLSVPTYTSGMLQVNFTGRDSDDER